MTMRSLALILLSATLLACGKQEAVTQSADTAIAKNVILFVGDGMGVSTVTATRIFDGQSKGGTGEENQLSFERFPHLALVKTYNTNQQVSDSAGTATAMMTGRKTKAGVVNIGPDAARGSCEDALANPLTTIADQAKDRGKAVGVVTTTRLSHAPPAAVYAKSPERDWEGDEFLPPANREKGCRDIAWQFANYDRGGGIDVALGGGSNQFYGRALGGKRRTADENLAEEWLQGGPGRRFVESSLQLAALQPGGPVLGLFSRSHMQYIARRDPGDEQPMLSEMTAKAIDLLEPKEKGYFLMVEGGRIDHGHHIGKAGYALLEAQEFAKAVQVAVDKVNLEETLVLVTADHSHVFTFGGYATRGNPILGHVMRNDNSGKPTGKPDIAADGRPYSSLQYANGPGAPQEAPRPEPETGIEAIQQALVPTQSVRIDGDIEISETHAGEDVALYAVGPGAEAVRGVLEQNRIYDIMINALGWTEAR